MNNCKNNKKRILKLFISYILILVIIGQYSLDMVEAISMNKGILLAANDSTVGNTNTTVQPKGDKIVTSDKRAIILVDNGAKVSGGSAGDKIKIELPLAVNREYIPSLDYVVRNITIEPKIPKDRDEIEDWPFEIKNISNVKTLKDMTYNSRADVFYEFIISNKASKGTYPVAFVLNATIWRKDEINGTNITEDVEFELIAYVEVESDGSESKKTNDLGALSIATVDKSGSSIKAPSGDAGQRVKLRLPLLNNGGTLTDVNISPVISNSLDEWPFVVEVINYGKKIKIMKPGDIEMLEYDFRISPEISSGAKPINFRSTYKENGVYKESLFSAYINVEKGKPEEEEEEELPDSVPKLMIIGYETDPEDILPGNDFKLVVDFQNSSYSEIIKNAGISLTFEENEVIPSKGKSDSTYINHLKPRETIKRTFYLKALPTIMEQSTTIVANINYETAKVTLGNLAQGIMLPIKQELKIVIEEPTIFADAPLIDEPIAVNIPMVNKGKTKAMNLTIEIESEDVIMLESYYGGDILPAAKNSADFQIVSKSAGDVVGNFIIRYEDVEGNEEEQRIPFSFFVEAEVKEEEQIVTESVETSKNKWKKRVGLGLIGLVVIVVIVIGSKKLIEKKPWEKIKKDK